MFSFSSAVVTSELEDENRYFRFERQIVMMMMRRRRRRMRWDGRRTQ